MEPATEDFTSKPSPWSVTETVERFSGAITSRGMMLFATIDQGAAAAAVGLELRETVMLIFGSPTAGTPVMDAVPMTALDLPLKLLIWNDADTTVVSYLRPDVLAARYGLPAKLATPLAGIDQLTDAVLASAGD